MSDGKHKQWRLWFCVFVRQWRVCHRIVSLKPFDFTLAFCKTSSPSIFPIRQWTRSTSWQDKESFYSVTTSQRPRLFKPATEILPLFIFSPRVVGFTDGSQTALCHIFLFFFFINQTKLATRPCSCLNNHSRLSMEALHYKIRVTEFAASQKIKKNQLKEPSCSWRTH